PPPATPLFPYTTLFRSCKASLSLRRGQLRSGAAFCAGGAKILPGRETRRRRYGTAVSSRNEPTAGGRGHRSGRGFMSNTSLDSRSEEHTSELQSPYDLV